MTEMSSDRNRMLREKRNIAWRSGPSSMTISMKSAPSGPWPTTRMMSLSEQRNKRFQRLPHGARHRGIAQIDVVMDLRRHVVDGEQLALVAHLDRDGLGAEAVENLLHHLFGQVDPVIARVECLRFVPRR